MKDQSEPFQIIQFQSSRSIREDASNILNGDFVRVRYNDKWLSHYPCQENSEEVYFESINDPFRQYNCIHSVFQILDKNLEHANPVVTGESNHYMLKHFVTGRFIHFNSPATLQAYDEVTTTETETPFFNLETENEDVLIQEKRPLRIKYLNNQGQETCLKIAEPKPVKQVQLEINTSYYFGFKIPEDYSYKNQKNLTRNLAGISTEFEIEGHNVVLEKISPEELSLIFKIEAYFKELERFALNSLLIDSVSVEKVEEVSSMIEKIIASSKEINKLLLQEEEDTKEVKLGVTTPKYKLKVPNRKVQSLIREFRIFDLIHILNYFYIIEVPKILSVPNNLNNFNGWKLLELYEEFGNIILNGLTENQTNRFYNSQFVRVYINSMLDTCNGGLARTCKEGNSRTQMMTVSLLKVLLWDNDLDALGQINYYIPSMKQSFEKNQTYQTHYLELLEHVSNSKASNFVNTFRDTFVNDLFSSEEKLVSILPQIVLKNEEVFVQFRKGAPLDLPINILALNQYASKYFIEALHTVIAVSSCKMTKFYHNMMKFYPLKTLKAAMGSEVSVEIKMLIHLIILHVHYAYVKIPFQCFPLTIQANNDKLQDLLYKGSEISGTCQIGPIEQTVLEEHENLKEEVDYILSQISDELVSLPFSLLKLSRASKSSPQKTKITLLYIETILNQESFSGGLFETLEDELKDLIKNTSEGDQAQLIYLPNVIEVCDLFYEKTKMQLTLSIYNEIKGGKSNEESLRKLIFDFGKKNLEGISLFDSLALNEPKVSSPVLSLLNYLSLLEDNVADELRQLIIFSSEEEVLKFKKILQINFELHRYNREFTTQKEKTGANTQLEYEEYEKIIQKLEELFLTIYDPSLHYYPHKRNVEQKDSKELEDFHAKFIQHYRKEKVPVRDNPLHVYPAAVSKQIQDVFRLLSVHDTLLNVLAWGFNFDLNNAPFDGLFANYLTRLIIGILIVFVYENKSNQLILSTSPALIKKYYDQSFLDKSTDTMTLFSEIMRNNEALLELSQKFLYDITCYSFVGTIKPRTFQNGGTYFFATLIAMHFLYKAKLPLTVYDTFNLIESRLKDILTSQFGVDLLTQLKNQPAPAYGTPINPTHIYYSIREFLKSAAQNLKQAYKDGKEAQINKLRNNFSCHKLIEGFSKPEFCFLFEVKNYLLKCISQMHLSKNNVNPNFLNIEDIPSASKLLFYLLNELYEFLQFTPNNLHKEASEKLNQDFMQTLEKMKGNIIDEEDVNGLFKEVRNNYQDFKSQSLLQRKVNIYMDKFSINTLWGDLYIFDSCWKVLAKLCVYYPEVIQVTEIFETFLSGSMYLIQSADKTNLEVFRKFKKYFAKLTSMKEYESYQVQIKGLISLINSIVGDSIDQPKNVNIENESSQNQDLISFINTLEGTQKQNLEENLHLFSKLITSNPKKNNILSQLLTVLQYNPFNLPHETTIFVSRLLKTYLKRSLPEKPIQQGHYETVYSEFYKTQKDLVDLDAERRIIEGITVAPDAQSVVELFSLILAFTSGKNVKLIESIQQNLNVVKHGLLPNNRELRRNGTHIEFILEEMIRIAKESEEGNGTLTVLDYLLKSHKLCTHPDNDEFRGITDLPSGELVENLRRVFDSMTQEIDSDTLFKSFGPIPLTLETIVEIFKPHENDNNIVIKLKDSFRKILNETKFEQDLHQYFKTIVTKNQENLDQVKLDCVLILDLYIGKIRNAILSQN